MEQRLGSLAALQRTQVQLLAPCWAVICGPLILRFFRNVPIPKLAGICPFGATTTVPFGGVLMNAVKSSLFLSLGVSVTLRNDDLD